MKLDQKLDALGLHQTAKAVGDIVGEAVRKALGAEDLLTQIADAELAHRRARSFDRRTRRSRIGRAAALGDFDFTHPRHVDRGLIDEAMTLRFVDEGGAVLLIGPPGVGKTHLAKAIVQQALAAGHTALVIDARALVHDLAAAETTRALERRLRHYVRPALLCIDELAYQHMEIRHLDLLYELVRRRYNGGRAHVVTACLPFAEWHTVMPSTAATAALVDRLMHKAIPLVIDAESYRLRQARQRGKK